MSAKSSVKDILLLDQSTWDGYYKNIKGSVPDYLWKYFDLDNDAIFVDLVALVEPIIKPLPEMPPPAIEKFFCLDQVDLGGSDLQIP